MPRVKNKPVELNETKFIDWLLEVYYYRMMDQGMEARRTPFVISQSNPEASRLFLEQVRSQMVQFDLSFPLTKLPRLYAQAIREVSTRPGPKPVEA
jgi:hypothetical protein